MNSILTKSPKYDRTLKTPSEDLRVDRKGGKYKAGVIYGVSLITVGEALGHGSWIDQEFVESVTEAANSSDSGLKLRFTHPGLSADGLGKAMGRGFDANTDGEQSKADVHFFKTAHKTPEGDLATYLMDLAEEDPKAFAMSIVFRRDRGEQRRHRANNSDEDGQFISPDPRNKKNYEHARLAELRAADFVDEPAANPNGLFHRGHEIADEADKLMSYALGLTDEAPDLAQLDADPDRIAAFARRFLNNHNLELTKAMATDTKTPDAGESTSDLAAMLDKFGENLLTKVDEKITSALADVPKVTNLKPLEGVTAKLQSTEAPSAGEAVAKERERVKQLTALSKNSGLSDAEELLSGWIDKDVTVQGAKAHIGELAIERNKLTTDGGETDPDPDKQFRKEFRANAAELAKVGTTEEEYIASRRIDEGLDVLGAKSTS